MNNPDLPSDEFTLALVTAVKLEMISSKAACSLSGLNKATLSNILHGRRRPELGNRAEELAQEFLRLEARMADKETAGAQGEA